MAKGQYPLGQKENVVPGSDLAGEIVAVGEEVKGWKVGERVSSNFTVDHVFGDPSKEIISTGLGAPIDGVLTEYKVIPAHVRPAVPFRSGRCVEAEASAPRRLSCAFPNI